MDGRQNHSRRADAALRTAAFQECFLQGVEGLCRRQSFDRNNAGTSSLEDRHQAAVYQCAIHQHGARTTLPFPATFLRARELKLMPQHVKQTLHRVSAHFLRLAVDHQRNLSPRVPPAEIAHRSPPPALTPLIGDEEASRSIMSSGRRGTKSKAIPSASSTALTIAGAGPSMGSSPMPLAPYAP